MGHGWEAGIERECVHDHTCDHRYSKSDLVETRGWWEIVDRALGVPMANLEGSDEEDDLNLEEDVAI